jgi:hypothetical protein
VQSLWRREFEYSGRVIFSGPDKRELAPPNRIRELLVTPHPVERAWDDGSRGEHFVCWTVLEHHPSNTGIAYCLQGFGPSSP